MELSVEKISKTYVRMEKSGKLLKRPDKVEKKALEDVSFTLKEGYYGLLGPNGAGKSTLMKIITGILKPDTGQVLWDGRDVLKMGKAFRMLLGFMPQQQGLYNSFTGERFLDYMCALKEIPAGQVSSEICRTASIVHLEDDLKKRLGAYSGGMKQRLLLSAALLGDPKLLILDEPTAGLDPGERVSLREKLKTLARDRIILTATHVVSDVESCADEILILKNGHLAEMGSSAALREKYGQERGLEAVYLTLFGEKEGGHDPADTP